MLLVYDARSHGESAGIPAPFSVSMRNDILAALDYGAVRPEVDPEHISVLSHSLGAFGIVLALAYSGYRIRAIVTDTMPARTQTMMESELRRHRIPQFPNEPLFWEHVLPFLHEHLQSQRDS